MTYEDEDPDEHVTHDVGDVWASKARYGWERCGGCGEEWGQGDEPSCTCNDNEDEEEEDAEE